MSLDPVLRDVVVCPACHGSLAEQPDELRCDGCGRGYPVRDGIPVLLVEQARQASA